jgi:ferritin-like metal-binding protein YciE
MATTIDPNDDAQLQAGRALVIQYLNEARATERALVTTLQAHITMTPHGAYRELLNRHLSETRRHARTVEDRLSELGAGAGVVSAAVGLVQTLTGQALALSKGPIDILRGSGGEEKLLKNAKDECATEALEIATYDALETLANAVGDGKTARLAADHRGDEERMLAELRRLIPALTHATVLARAGGEPSYDVTETGAADNVRALRDHARGGRRRATASGGDELPIEGYDSLNAGQVVTQLTELTQQQLRKVGEYERRTRSRRSVLERIDALAGEEPWAGYDELTEAAVIERLQSAEDAAVSQVRDYEGRHRRRVAVLEAAQQ